MADKEEKRGRPARTEEEFQRLGEDLVKDAKEHLIHLAPWALKHNHAPSWVNDLAEKSETFSEALRKARAYIGERWLKQSFQGKISGPFAMHKPGMYLDDVKQHWLDNYRANEKIKAAAAAEIAAAKEKGEETDALKRIADMLEKYDRASK